MTCTAKTKQKIALLMNKYCVITQTTVEEQNSDSMCNTIYLNIE